MFKLLMQKTYFHNSKQISENLNTSPPQAQQLDYERITDINNLLNRVKINEKNEIKKKIISFSLISLGMIIFTSIFLF